MAQNKKQSRSQQHYIGLLNFAPGSYLESTSRPIYALLFLLPLVLIYEIGVLANISGITQSQPPIATFSWLVGLAEWLGLSRYLAWAFPGPVVHSSHVSIPYRAADATAKGPAS